MYIYAIKSKQYFTNNFLCAYCFVLSFQLYTFLLSLFPNFLVWTTLKGQRYFFTLKFQYIFITTIIIWKLHQHLILNVIIMIFSEYMQNSVKFKTNVSFSVFFYIFLESIYELLGKIFRNANFEMKCVRFFSNKFLTKEFS